MTMPERGRAETGGLDQAEVLYVSWGGTGRAATVRHALIQAGRTGRRMAYLAILDDGAFGDVDPAMLDLASDELSWLLDAQLDLTKRQTNLDDVPVRVLVRSGDVVARVVEVAEAGEVSEILIGAPGSLADTGSVADLVDQVRRRLEVSVEIIEPE